MKIVQLIAKSNSEDPVLILEDDFIADGFANTEIQKALKVLPPTWGIYYAGHCHPRTCARYLSAMLCGTTNAHVSCAHAYFINGAKSAKEISKLAIKKSFYWPIFSCMKAILAAFFKFRQCLFNPKIILRLILVQVTDCITNYWMKAFKKFLGFWPDYMNFIKGLYGNNLAGSLFKINKFQPAWCHYREK